MLNGYVCVTAENGLEALELVKSRMEKWAEAKKALEEEGKDEDVSALPSPQFTVIFCDVIMPKMDGLQATREIRKLEIQYGLPPAPIVAMTAQAMNQDRVRCSQAGMDFFISKPFARSDVMGVIDPVVKKLRKAKQDQDKEKEKEKEEQDKGQ